MTSQELHLVYLSALENWLREEGKTRTMVTQDLAGYAEQVRKEDEALKTYREARDAYVQVMQQPR
jgi:hypothetical protein